MSWNTYSFSVESIHKVLQSSIFILLLSDDSVLPDDLLLVSGLQELNSDPSLLLGLSHQTVHQHLLPPCLLLKKNIHFVQNLTMTEISSIVNF